MTHNVLDLIETFTATNGFAPDRIYCQVTGKPIGTLNSEEFAAIVDDIGGVDIEDTCDDLLVRMLASLRPSMRWNRFREDTLVQMRVKHPAETLAYLVNRLFHPLNHRKLPVTDLLRFYENRIKGFQMIAEWGTNDSTNTLTFLLLELDAKWNLDTEFPPFSWDDFFNAESMNHRIELLQAWHGRRMEAWVKRVKAEEMQTKWHRSGSALAKPAFGAAWMEAPPSTKTGIAKAEKKKEHDFFAGLLSAIQMGKIESKDEQEAVAPSVEFVPIKKMPLKFGVKK